MGGRLLKRWLALPLKDVAKIKQRHEVVKYLLDDEAVLQNIQGQIKHIGDIERLISKIATAKVSPREVIQLKNSLEAIVPIKSIAETCNNEALKVFDLKNIRSSKRDTLQKTILSINKKEIKQKKFFDYIRNRRHKSILDLFNDFKNEEILTYFKEQLKYTEPSFANALREYEEGLIELEGLEEESNQKTQAETVLKWQNQKFNLGLKEGEFRKSALERRQ